MQVIFSLRVLAQKCSIFGRDLNFIEVSLDFVHFAVTVLFNTLLRFRLLIFIPPVFFIVDLVCLDNFLGGLPSMHESFLKLFDRSCDIFIVTHLLCQLLDKGLVGLNVRFRVAEQING